MSQPRKFLFDKSFDGETAEPSGSAEETTAPVFTEADIAAAEQRGFDHGQSAALVEAKSCSEERIAACLDTLTELFGDLANQAARSQEQNQRDALEVARHALGKLFPVLAERGGLAEAEQVIEACLARLRDEPRVVLRTADDLHDLLKDRIEDLAGRSGFEGRIVLLTEEDMGPSDVRVEWADGGAERDAAGLWTEVEGVIERTFGTVGPAPDPFPESATSQETEQSQQPEETEPELTAGAMSDPDLDPFAASA